MNVNEGLHGCEQNVAYSMPVTGHLDALHSTRELNCTVIKRKVFTWQC